MTSPAPAQPQRHLHIGDLHVSREPLTLRTLLGSCVSACVYDPDAGVGGMNHIFLPSPPAAGRPTGCTRFGSNAMDSLIAGILELGGARARLQAKVFGGARLVRGVPPERSTGALNGEFVLAYLERAGIPVLERDLGGSDTRILSFHTCTGAASVRRVPSADLRRILDAECRLGRELRKALDPEAPSPQPP